MKLKLQLTAAVLSLSLGVSAQTGKIAIKNSNPNLIQSTTKEAIKERGCGTNDPGTQWDAWFNKQVEEYKANNPNAKSQMVNYTIPVVVHVVHSGQSVGTGFNISQAQVIDQINILNADYAGTGLNSGSVPSAFAALKANCQLSFCLATKNPTGGVLPEPGIDRISASSKGWTTGNYSSSYVDGTIKPNSIWDPTRYMNMWVLDLGGGLLGYATFPTGTGLTGITGNGTATTDGVVMLNTAFGSIGSAAASAPYNKGRTTTHEVGHWLGLRHIWGDAGQCGGSDFCNDTPPQRGQTTSPAGCYYGCPTFPAQPNTCTQGGITNTNGDMFMNFMDYTDDACMYMFTIDQRTRIQTAMNTGTYRSLLSTSANTLCTVVAAAPTASFTMLSTACTTAAVNLYNYSTSNPTSTYVWSANPSTGVTFNPSNTSIAPTVNFTTPGNYSITVVATNTAGNNSSTKTISITTCATGTTTTLCNDTITNVTPTGTLLPNAAGSDTATPGCSPKAGYIMGSNCYDDLEKAEFFNSSLYSGIASPQIKSVIVIFYKDGSRGTGGNNTTAVNLKIYNGTMSGGPTGTATPLGTVNANIGNILAVTATNSANYVGNPGIVYTNPILRPYKYTFATPVNAPATNGFFASITIPTAAGDTAVIMDDGSLAAGTNWELWSDNSWHSIPVAWSGYDASMAILPVMQCGTVTAINSNSILDANISLHPNPTNGIINAIVTLPNSQNLDITISNTLGQVISNTKHSNVSNNVFTLDLNNYNNGVYFVTFNNGQEKIVKRVILNK
jgi:hypothetical protein